MLNRDIFEITEEKFNNYKLNVLEMFDKKYKVQFKGFKERSNTYMLIDNSGNAYVPVFNKDLINNQNLKIDERKIVGNINVQMDWDNIIYYLMK